jgi:hypothetical protein
MKRSKYSYVVVFVFIGMFFSIKSQAQDWKNPEAKFDARKLMTEKSTISWRRVDDVQKTCEAESRKRGFSGFGYRVNACSFWEGGRCDIFTSKSPTTHDLGHETRHCFQGAFH